MEKTTTGIGRALHKARLRRRKSLEEASRDTRLRVDYLLALEEERFDDLEGEVYVRAFLRSYAGYLGLNPDKVMAVFDAAFGPPPPAPPPGHGPPGVPPVGHEIRRLLNRSPSWVLAAAAAMIVLLSAAATGLLDRSASTPQAAPLTVPPELEALPAKVRVDLAARSEVHAVVHIDGTIAFSGPLRNGDVRSFEAQERVDVRLSRGGAVRMQVCGADMGLAGHPDRAFVGSFGPSDCRAEG